MGLSGGLGHEANITSSPSMVPASLDKKAVEAVSAAVKQALRKRCPVISKKVRKVKSRLSHSVARDSYEYRQDGEVSASDNSAISDVIDPYRFFRFKDDNNDQDADEDDQRPVSSQSRQGRPQPN